MLLVVIIIVAYAGIEGQNKLNQRKKNEEK